MKKQMSPELRALRRKFPLPVSRLAYTRLYEKAKDVMGHLAALNVPGLGDIDILFQMLHNASKDIDPVDLAANHPALLCIYHCLLADMDAARIRSERARVLARRRAEGYVAPQHPRKPAKRQLDEEERKSREEYERKFVEEFKDYVHHLPRFFL